MAPRQAEAGTPAEDLCRKLGMSEASFYGWTQQCASRNVPEVRELRQLREENRKLKTLLAEPSLDETILHDALPGEISSPASRRRHRSAGVG